MWYIPVLHLTKSATCHLKQLYIPMEIAQPTIAELGELGLIQFRDVSYNLTRMFILKLTSSAYNHQLNPDVNAFQRTFVNEIRRLDDMERKLRTYDTAFKFLVANSIVGFLKGQVEKATLPIRPVNLSQYARARTFQEIDELEERLSEHDGRIQQMNTSQETLNKRYLELTELRHVLKETSVFFDEVSVPGSLCASRCHVLA
jgi:V-type H+-transporting ATPase subunit a